MLSTLVQESLICLLCYNTKYGGRIRNLVPIQTWDGVYKQVAERAYDYWTQYKEPPGEHALDIFDAVSNGNPKSANKVQRLYESVQEVQEGINPKYVIGQVSSFLREQNLRTGIIDAVELIEQGKVDEAEVRVRKSLDGVVDVFDPGLLFHQLSLNRILEDRRDAIPTGIEELDKRGFGPARGELLMFVAPSGFGKSWFLMHLAKHAIIHRKKVLYVSLELSQDLLAQRFVQSFCAVSKRRAKRVQNVLFERNSGGYFCGLKQIDVKVKSFDDANIIKSLTKKMQAFKRRTPLVIKQFPTASLTMQQLEAYINSLEAGCRIVPDLLIVDYPDLMSAGRQAEHDYRIALGQLIQKLRGLGVERNMAVAAASQSVRKTYAGSKKIITGGDIAEDISKINTSDTVITYNRTQAEYELGTARLQVDKGRNDEDKFGVLISQNYRIGQFCIDSVRMNTKYWQVLEDNDFDDDDETPRRRKRKQTRQRL